MDWLNYHHLRCFWTVAREGGIVAAGKALRLSHPTLSAQIHTLEEHLGVKLFTKVGRKLVLTDTGRIVYRYAEEIFSLGREMLNTVEGRSTGKALRFQVGVANAVPKLVVRRLLEPALDLPEPVHLFCYEDSYETLLGDLAMHRLDIVISDGPVPAASAVRAFDHLLAETSVSLFATPKLAKTYQTNFPQSLNGAPMLLPLEQLTLRRTLNRWFEQHGITPRVVAEFEDSALLKVFGADGYGIFPAPTVVADEIKRQYGTPVLAHLPEVRERFYAISVEKRLQHPAVIALLDAARRGI